MTKKGLMVLSGVLALFGAGAVAYVVSARDSGQADYYDEIRELCRGHGIAFLDRGAPVPPADYAFAISWRWLMDAPNLIVLHDSLLPRYRGHAPLVAALINGDEEIGVTAFLATKEVDAGPIVGCGSLSITYPITVADATEAISGTYQRLTAAIMGRLLAGETLTVTPQDERFATYSLWRDDDDYRIDWGGGAEDIQRFIDATGSPYKGAKTKIDWRTFRIMKAEPFPDVCIENRTPGKVIFIRDGFPIVVCGSGLLKITKMRFDNGANALPLDRLRTRFA